MIGMRLRELREAKGLSRKAVAEKINIDQTTYGKYELNKREPDSETLKKLADFFEVTVDYLLGREIKTQPDPKPPKKEIVLSEKEMKDIKHKAENIAAGMMAAIGLAFDGKIEDDETLAKVMAALEEGSILAKKRAKEKYTPKKYRK